MNHVHISTGFAFVATLLLLGILGIVFAFLIARRKAANEERRWALYATQRQQASVPLKESVAGSCRPSYSSPSYSQPSPAPVAPAVVHTNGGGSDMMTGVLLGSMLSNHGHHDTYVHHDTTRDSGMSSYDPDSRNSGFDFSWGGDSSSSFDSGTSFSFGD